MDKVWKLQKLSWVLRSAARAPRLPLSCFWTWLDLTGTSAIVRGAAVEWCAVACNRTRGHSNGQMQMMSRLLNSHKTGLCSLPSDPLTPSHDSESYLPSKQNGCCRKGQCFDIWQWLGSCRCGVTSVMLYIWLFWTVALFFFVSVHI